MLSTDDDESEDSKHSDTNDATSNSHSELENVPNRLLIQNVSMKRSQLQTASTEDIPNYRDNAVRKILNHFVISSSRITSNLR